MKIGYGDFFKKHRIASGYKRQNILAEKTGISPATISRIENEVQKPEVRTIHTLSNYLTSTSSFELMAICGYLTDEEHHNQHINAGHSAIDDKNNRSKTQNNVNVSPEIDKIFKEYNFTLDGKTLTAVETNGIIAYVRTLRQMNK